jgi:filamentous hemagglutinin family protein
MNIQSDSKLIKPLPYYLVPFWVGFLIFLMSYFPALLFALPQDGQIVAGNGNIQQPNSQNMVINQSSNQMITNWQGFNIGQSESVQFNQPGSNSVALNRVIGQDPTAILGKLNANGQIFITNPSGVFFGPNSIINVGSLMATSLQISDQDFLNRNYRFTQDPSKPLASVINEGQINASGYIGLLGPRAENRGMLTANLGSIALGSGKAATMDFSGDGLISFAITQPVDGSFVDKDGNTIENGAFNSGTIQADGGKVLLTAHTAQKMIQSVVNNTGVIRAQSVSKRNGAIYLEAGPNGTATNEGTLDASGTDSGETGGTVHIFGDKVGQFGTASIDVSGDQGGGEALIGGDYQGKGSVQNASVTFGGSETVVKANAITNGNGGRVIYWADDTTRFFGAIEAQGGANSGDGGFVEVSGKQFLDFNGEVITTAANGNTGTLLLDPQFIDVVDLTGPNDSEITSGSPLGEILAADGGSSASFSISQSALEGLSSSTNIVLQATDNITIQDLSDNLLDLQQVSGHSVKFEAQSGTITFNDINDVVRTQGGAITFIAGTTLTMGKLDSNGGNIDLTAGTTLSALKEIRSMGGAISFSAGSTLSTGPINSGGGAISLTGVGINVMGNIATGGKAFSADAGTGTYNQSSNVTVATAGGDASLIADSFDLLNGFTNSGGNIFGLPSSIVTDTFSFLNGSSSGTITITQKTNGKTICIAITGCNVVLSGNEIVSLRTNKLIVGNSNSGSIFFGGVDLGHKVTNFISGDSISGTGANIVFHDDIVLKAKENITFISGSSFEAHVSGFNADFTAEADSDQLDGGGFELSSNSFIRTQGGNVNISGNSIAPSGSNPDNIITNGGSYNRIIRTTTFTSFEELLEALFQQEDDIPGVPESEDPQELPDELPDLPRNRVLSGAFPNATPDQILTFATNRDQGNQAAVLGDFLDNGGFNKPNC